MTAGTTPPQTLPQTAAPVRGRRRTAEAAALWSRFPPRPVPATWPSTGQDRDEVVARLLAQPYARENAEHRYARRLGVIKTMGWLGAEPGKTWQDRWNASGAGLDGTVDWRDAADRRLKDTGQIAADNQRVRHHLGSSLGLLICCDVIRPSLAWLLTSTTPSHLAGDMARIRDPDGFAALAAAGASACISHTTTRRAMIRIAAILGAKGGTVADITVGDCLELLEAKARLGAAGGSKGTYFYQLLHATGIFPPGAPRTVRMFDPRVQGQLTVEQMLDRYDLACRPVRDLLVDYLSERRPGIDYTTLDGLAYRLGMLFWKDLETHHPGIDSLRLAPDVAVAWKQRLQHRTIRSTTATGQTVETQVPRLSVMDHLTTVRAFYLDIAEWATADPGRWAQWSVPCPIRDGEITHRKELGHRKSRTDQRTRERMPALPSLIAAAEQARTNAAERLATAQCTNPGELFTAGSQTLRRAALKEPSRRTWVEHPDTGARRDLTLEEDHAFWAWAAVETLRLTGIRVEELTELSHHSLVQYRLPTTGELIPLLHIAPSKTDIERTLVVAPELADVLAAIVARVRNDDGAVPLVDAYDPLECVWNPPMPLLFQHRIGVENRPISRGFIRRRLIATAAGSANASGGPLTFTPHDFRRLLTTDALQNGMPPHIAQVILGHKNLNTTMGYNTVYPEKVITGHRAFLARRRELRPSEEYRTPTDQEWEEFLGHFERRKVALGNCGRAYGTSCVHEHSCERCSLLRVDPTQRPRLLAIRDNLTARIAEAHEHGWLGEAEGLQVNLAAVKDKLFQLDALTTRRTAAINLGLPTFPHAADRTVTTSLTRPAGEEIR